MGRQIATVNKSEIFYEEFLDKISNKIINMSTKVSNADKKHSENNIFYILGIQDFEIRHSNFLAWLFKNEEDFLRQFLKNCNLPKEYIDNISLKPGDFEVFREYKKQTNGRSIDIVLDFKKDKFVIAIENKWKAGESEMQLADYYRLIENSSDFMGYKKIYVYLTLNGIKPKSELDKENYLSVSYANILEILKKLKMGNKLDEKSLIIKNYIEILEENTIKVMDRIKEYYKLYEENKDVMMEMVEYIPNIKARAELERNCLLEIGLFDLESLNQNTFIWFTPKIFTEHFASKNLPKNYLQFCLSNEPYNVMSMQFVINKDKENKHVKFSEEFRREFNRVDKNKDATYAILLTENLVVSNKNAGYLTEKQFQEMILLKLKQFFTDKDNTYQKIIDFVLNYDY